MGLLHDVQREPPNAFHMLVGEEGSEHDRVNLQCAQHLHSLGLHWQLGGSKYAQPWHVKE